MIASFAKVCACAAVIIGAPLIVASASDLYRIEVEKYLDYKACLIIAEQYNTGADCKL
jgi:hypothetical protein